MDPADNIILHTTWSQYIIVGYIVRGTVYVIGHPLVNEKWTGREKKTIHKWLEKINTRRNTLYYYNVYRTGSGCILYSSKRASDNL